MPTCTVAIPVYNRQDYLLRALKSALDQDAVDLEVIIVDNASTDASWELAHGVRDPRLRIFRNTANLGLFGNFNRCLELAQGRYVRILCSDDQLAPHCLAREIDVMERCPGVSVLTTRGRRVDPEGRLLSGCARHFAAGIYQGQPAIYAALWLLTHYAADPFNCPSGVLLRRSATQATGWFDTSMCGAGDVDYYLRCLEHGDLAVLEQIGCEITVHPRQESSWLERDPRLLTELFDIARRHQPLVERMGDFRRLQRQFAAYSAGMSLKHWREGQPEASRAFRSLIGQNAGTLSTCVAFARLLAMRTLFRWGVRLTPVRPIQVLHAG